MQGIFLTAAIYLIQIISVATNVAEVINHTYSTHDVLHFSADQDMEPLYSL